MSKTKAYIILGYNPKTDEYIGYVERSFDMTFDKKLVRVFELKHTYLSDQKNWNWYKKMCDEIKSKEHKDYEFRLYRVGSKHCPVKIDWTPRTTILKRLNTKDEFGEYKVDKYKWRNLPFIKKSKIKI